MESLPEDMVEAIKAIDLDKQTQEILTTILFNEHRSEHASKNEKLADIDAVTRFENLLIREQGDQCGFDF